MQDRPLGHGRYHRPAVEPPADDGAGADPRPPSASRVGVAALLILGGALVAWRGAARVAIVLVWPILFFVPGWVVIRRVAPDLPRPGCGRRRDRHEHLRLGPPRERRRPGRPGSGAGRSSSARSCSRSRRVVFAQRPPSLARAARAADPRRHRRRALRADAPGLDRRRRGRPRRPRRPRQQRLARDARTAGSRAAGTGATSSSTSRSARASPPATSRPRSPTSPACR